MLHIHDLSPLLDDYSDDLGRPDYDYTKNLHAQSYVTTQNGRQILFQYGCLQTGNACILETVSDFLEIPKARVGFSGTAFLIDGLPSVADAPQRPELTW